jgi:uncharacterized protein (DUF2147 family)
MAPFHLLAAAGLLVAGDGTGGLDVEGYWYTPDRDVIVHITDCGDGTPCGRVVWLDEERARVLIDEHNDDPALRDRPIMGITLLGGFEEGEKGWRGGTIYNPENGDSYDARVRRLDADELEVKGCIGPFCRGFVWEAADAAMAGADSSQPATR